MVIVETVGVGQAEVDVAAATDTTLVVLAPARATRSRWRRRASWRSPTCSWSTRPTGRGPGDVARDLRQMLHMGARGRVDTAGGPRRPRTGRRASTSCGRRSPSTGAHLDGDGPARAKRRAPAAARGRGPGRRALPRRGRGALRADRRARRRACRAPRSTRTGPRLSWCEPLPRVAAARAEDGRSGGPSRRPWPSAAYRRRSRPSATPTSRRSPASRSSRCTGPRTSRASIPAERLGEPGEYPFTRGVYPVDVPGPAVDDAAVRRIRHAGRDQRALPVPAGAGAGRPLGSLRHAHADGPGLRRPARARARSAAAAWPPTRWTTSRRCSTASRSATSRRR